MTWRFLAIFLVIGCTGPTGPARDVAAHQGHLKLGAAPLGGSLDFAIELDHISGQRPVQITDVEVMGDSFSATDDDLPSIRVDGQRKIHLRYEPLEEGDHFAEIIVAHNGASGAVSFYVEASAVRPQVLVWPPVLDFGPRVAGSAPRLQVRLQNDSRWDLEISSLSFSGVIDEVELELPRRIEAGGPIWFGVRIATPGAEPDAGQLTLRVGDLALDTVSVLVNDCVNGDPALYDQDQDGVTTCEGDCDDTDPYIHPGADEIDNNGLDDDCNDISS